MNFSSAFSFSAQAPSSFQYANQSFTPQGSDQLEWADSLILQSPSQANLQSSQASPGSSVSQDYLLSPARPQPRSSPQESGQMDDVYPAVDSYGQRPTMGLNSAQQTSGSLPSQLTLSPDVSLDISLQGGNAYLDLGYDSSVRTNRKRSAPHDETQYSTGRSQSIADQPIILNSSIDVDASDPSDSHLNGHTISPTLQANLRQAGLAYSRRQRSRDVSQMASQTSDAFLMSDCPELQISQEENIPDYARDLTTAPSRSTGRQGLGSYSSGANIQRSSEQPQDNAQAIENASGGYYQPSPAPGSLDQARVNMSPGLQSSGLAQGQELRDGHQPQPRPQHGSSRFGPSQQLQTEFDLQEGAVNPTQSGASPQFFSRSPTAVYSIAMIACVTAFLAGPLAQLQHSSTQWLSQASPFVTVTTLLFCAAFAAQLPSVLTTVTDFRMDGRRDVGSWVALAVLGWLTGMNADSDMKTTNGNGTGSGLSLSGKLGGEVDAGKEVFGDGYLDCMFEMSPVTVLGMV